MSTLMHFPVPVSSTLANANFETLLAPAEKSRAIWNTENFDLLNQLKAAVKDERKLLVQILEYLREVERRKLYLQMAYPSLFEFCVRYLNYSESAAYRRIQAVRLSSEIPAITEKLAKGTLNLTQVSQAATFFSLEKKKNKKSYSVESKFAILKTLENKSKREVEKKLVELSLSIQEHTNMSEILKFIGRGKCELKTVIAETVIEKCDRIKALLSHKNPKMSYADVISEMADITLKKIDRTLR